MANNKKAWRYQIDYLFDYRSELLLGVTFENNWVTIGDGVITIKQGYAWDGCSPAWYLPVVGWMGAPDGPVDSEGRPQSYYATLVHDALCQFRTELLIPKKVTVDLFKELLLRGGFPQWRANLYSKVVNLLGPQNWSEATPIYTLE